MFDEPILADHDESGDSLKAEPLVVDELGVLILQMVFSDQFRRMVGPVRPLRRASDPAISAAQEVG